MSTPPRPLKGAAVDVAGAEVVGTANREPVPVPVDTDSEKPVVAVVFGRDRVGAVVEAGVVVTLPNVRVGFAPRPVVDDANPRLKPVLVEVAGVERLKLIAL